MNKLLTLFIYPPRQNYGCLLVVVQRYMYAEHLNNFYKQAGPRSGQALVRPDVDPNCLILDEF